MNYRFSDGIRCVDAGAINDLLKAAADPGIINFGGGMPDATLFPIDELALAHDETIRQRGAQALQYGLTMGVPALRDKIAEKMRRFGVSCTRDEILVSAGGQQAIDFCARVFLNEGDKVIVEAPTFVGALATFAPHRPTILPVPMDHDGMRMDALEQTLRENPDTRLIYTITDFQNPMGVTMSLERRRRMMEIVQQYDVIVIEDTPYRELRFAGQTLPALKSFDTRGQVVYIGSFSKILSPGIRLGWSVASPEVTAMLATAKTTCDTQASSLSQMAVDCYMDRFDLDAHIDALRALYRDKAGLMYRLFDELLPAGCSHTTPEGGLFVWLTLPEGVRSTQVLARALEEKVAFVPGFAFYHDASGDNHMRVSYAASSPERIEQGVRTLCRVLAEFC